MSTFEFVNVGPPSQPLPNDNRYKYIKFAEINPGDASGKIKPAMHDRSKVSDIPLDKLNEQGKHNILALVHIHRIPVDHLFKLDAEDQLKAAAIMVQHGLDLEGGSTRWRAHINLM
ncbi:hypothetical protein B0H19DRAFT_1247744 [Mycena capillaripes]|nr:hypothetical protein B0H19DRAFT_1247744 [Mycena capillaripes]